MRINFNTRVVLKYINFLKLNSKIGNKVILIPFRKCYCELFLRWMQDDYNKG